MIGMNIYLDIYLSRASLAAQTVKYLPAMKKTWSLGQEDTLEKGMATHSSILAWRIPRIEEPGGLQSMGLQELDMTEQLTHTHRLDIIHFLHKVIQLSF